MRWDPYATIRNALWVGGGQWSGKTTVAELLAERHTLTHYHQDYHDARGHHDRRVAARLRRGEPAGAPPAGVDWDGATPRQLADEVLAGFAERFAWVLDDLRGLTSPRPVIADGWGLRPELVAAVTPDPRRMIVMVPTDAFREAQAGRLPRARHPHQLARDRLVAADAVRQAHAHGIRVLEVDGTLDAGQVAGILSDHFGPFVRT